MVRREVLAEGVEVWLGDMREILPTLDGDVITDPPYGIEFHYSSHRDTEEAFSEMMKAFCGRPVAALQYPEEMMRLMVPVLGAPHECMTWVYGSNLPRQTRLWGVWGGIDVDPSRSKQFARNPEAKKVVNLVVAGYDWREFPQVKNTSKDKTAHPCQLPIEVADWVVGCVVSKHIIDPFLGSGTVGVSAVKAAVPFTGVEIDPGYFDIACRRIEAALAAPDMFIDPPKPMKQEALL